MKHCLLFILLSFLQNSAYSQSLQGYFKYEINYISIFQPDSTDKSSIKSENVVLYIGNDQSFYTFSKLLLEDSLMKYADRNPVNLVAFGEQLKSYAVKDNIFILKNISETKTIQNIIGINPPRCYTYTEGAVLFNWEILSDTMSINGLACQKATTHFGNRIWEAWFCPSIPISEGPYKFRGLPGLIVKINDIQNYWNFELSGFVNKDTSLYLSTCSENAQHKVLDKNSFFKEKRYILDNRFQINLANGTRYVNSKAKRDDEISKEKAAKADNNWIELYKRE